MQTENEVKSLILEYLSKRNIFHRRINVGKFNGHYKTGKKGDPDIFAIVCGKHIGIEVKKKGGTQSDDQKQCEFDLIQAGAYYVLAFSFEEFLDKFLVIERQIYYL